MLNYRVALIFNANKSYDRQVIEGIGDFISLTDCQWDIYIEESFCTSRISEIVEVSNGIIADLDDQNLVKILGNSHTPYVGVGGSFHNVIDYPKCNYVATDNYALIRLAFEHLMKKGITHIAFYNISETQERRWAAERERAYYDLTKKHFFSPQVYNDYDPAIQNRDTALVSLTTWMKTLPANSGIIAVTDSRARHLLQAAALAGLRIPQDIAVIGIDNEELVNYLSRISLTTVVQGTRQIGFTAARLLQTQLEHGEQSWKRIVVPPAGIKERMSTNVMHTSDPLVGLALKFISENIHRQLKVSHVINYLSISRTLLDNKFQRALSCKVHTVIIREKLRRCQTLLKNNTIPISDIPQLAGFPSINYFYNFFRREMSITPAQYRQQHAERR